MTIRFVAMSTASAEEQREMPAAVRSRREVGELIVGRFRLVKPLGQGATGLIWLAEDERLDELVALKFLKPGLEFESRALDDLRRETVRSHRLTHPNIIRIHDFHDSDESGPFISMEYVEGISLDHLRRDWPNGLFTWRFLQPVVLQLCEALRYAHGQQVVHRDLKPANLILDHESRLKLADFGIAGLVQDGTPKVSPSLRLTGTLPYMSPQQISGLTPHPTDDVYSLGTALYEMLTGCPPFFRGDIAHQVRDTMPEPLGRRLRRFGLKNDVPPHIEALVMACLTKRPDRRPQTAAAILHWIGPEIRLRGIRSRVRGWHNRLSSVSRPGGQSY
jgi:serine/threonine protein kinase